ncbi:barstar family protein [Streptomyces blastmyceticus]|uniref:Barstar (barnase inhibitor) domain-containing protein n=1 Tax=Streptomyces blastmyceticus TaxID=68180 RepID=A0ABN0WSI8_9ACTN
MIIFIIGEHVQFDYEISYIDAEGEETAWGHCVAVAGLFREPMPPTREVLTLVGCAQARPLAAGATQLGELCLIVSNDVRPLQWWGLTEAVVLARRPHALDPELVDVVLEVVVSGPDSGQHELPDSPQFELDGGWPESVSYGTCLSVNGLYEERPEPPEIPITLVGCRPGVPMLSALTEGEAEHLMLGVLDRQGRSMADRSFYWHVRQTRPSVLGGALVDIVLSDGVDEPVPPAARQAWEDWYERSMPSTVNTWAGYPPEGRKEWLKFSAPGRFPRWKPEEDEKGGTYHLDGRYVTDEAGLHCAVGEALKGPGGYFGRDWYSFKAYLEGGYGVGLPFTLVWHDSQVTLKALAGTINPENGLSYAEEVVDLMRRWGVTVVLK